MQTMPQIKTLPPTLVNKIAAGEVIERPASVVKELVENALDAGATRIDIALEDGGTRLIRVTDNGQGIGRDDLPLAVAAHATSKIHADDDLFNIRSLGFRGEALASIAAVSHLRICSRPAGQLEAYALTTTDGDATPPKPCAAPVGTTVEVRNIFYNVPARRKFLRRPNTELSHTTEQLARLALAHPHIAFTLAHNGRTTRHLPKLETREKRPETRNQELDNADKKTVSGDDSLSMVSSFQSPVSSSLDSRRARIGAFYGTELAECLIPVDRQERAVRIEALIAPPDQSRASTKWQYLFLNGRFITDRRIGYAVRESFRGLIEHDRFPVTFIFLTTDPDQFDVNVHPTKIEVRWRDAGLIQSQVLAVLRETLLGHNLTPRLHAPAESGDATTPADTLHQRRARQAVADYLKSVDPTQARIEFRPPRFPTHGLRPSIASTFGAPVLEEPPGRRAGLSQVGFAAGGQPPDPVAAPEADIGADACRPGGRPDIPPGFTESGAEGASDGRGGSDVPGSSVLQVHNTYIVAQTDEGLVIIDQHALHERILYEKFCQRILAGPLEAQRLLIPQTLEVSPQQAQAAEQHQDLLLKLGIEISTFGPNAVAVQSFPTLLPDVDINLLLSDLLDKLAEPDSAESDESLMHAALDMMACKAAVKAGDPLSTEEMQALLAQRQITDKPSNCPHGRPTTLQLSTRDLEKQFKRV
jgi:DNA mismatch repair protein MutL